MTVDALVGRQVYRAGGHIVMPVAGVAWRKVLEERREVGMQQRLEFVDDDGGRGVEGLDVDEAEANAGL